MSMVREDIYEVSWAVKEKWMWFSVRIRFTVGIHALMTQRLRNSIRLKTGASQGVETLTRARRWRAFPLAQLSGTRNAISDSSAEAQKFWRRSRATAVFVSEQIRWYRIVMISGHQHPAAGPTFHLHPFIQCLNLSGTQFTFRTTTENAQRESIRIRLMQTEKPDLIKGFARLFDFSTHYNVEFVVGVMIVI
jgi:hypothetical protein